MKKLFFLLCGIVMSAIAAPGQDSAAIAAQIYEMNFAGPYFDRHSTTVRAFKPWIAEMNKQSGGRIDITYFPPNTIVPESEGLDSVANGTVEIGGSTFNRNAGRLMMAEIAQLPMLSSSPKAFAMGWWDVCSKYPQYFPEFQNDIKLLYVWSSALAQIHTTKKPVRKLEDLKNLKLIGWTTASLEFIRLLGAIPMSQSSSDTYLALERGMADGVVCPVAPLRSQKLTDILKYHTIADLWLSPFWGGMNGKLFNSMPADLQKLIDDSTGAEYSGMIAQTLEDAATEDLEWIRQQGRAEIIRLDEAERLRWVKALEPLKNGAIKTITGSNNKITEADCNAVYDYFVERIAYHTEHSLK